MIFTIPSYTLKDTKMSPKGHRNHPEREPREQKEPSRTLPKTSLETNTKKYFQRDPNKPPTLKPGLAMKRKAPLVIRANLLNA